MMLVHKDMLKRISVDRNMTEGALRSFAYVVSHSKDLYCPATQVEIAAFIGMSRASVNKGIALLCKAGVMKRDRICGYWLNKDYFCMEEDDDAMER